MDRILIPLTRETEKAKKVIELRGLAIEINRTRNAVIHRGEFRSEAEASETIDKTKQFVERLVRLYEPTFTLGNKGKKSSERTRK